MAIVDWQAEQVIWSWGEGELSARTTRSFSKTGTFLFLTTVCTAGGHLPSELEP